MPSQQAIAQMTDALKEKNVEEINRIFLSNCANSQNAEIAAGFLHYVIQLKDLDLFQLFLEQRPSFNVSNEKGQTPLSLAVVLNLPEIVNALVVAGADVNGSGTVRTHVRTICNYCPIHAAAETKNIDLLKLLMNLGADVNQIRKISITQSMPPIKARVGFISYQDVEEHTALDIMKKQGCAEEDINYLLNQGAISAKNGDENKFDSSCLIM